VGVAARAEETSGGALCGVRRANDGKPCLRVHREMCRPIRGVGS
jgi:hypothetical protein